MRKNDRDCRVTATSRSIVSVPNYPRCGQPAQQHGLRIPPLSLESAFSMRIFFVSAFLPDVTQHIHSFRASGVISSHTSCAAGVEEIALRKSDGILCTVAGTVPFLSMRYCNKSSFSLNARVGRSHTGGLVQLLHEKPACDG